MKKAKKVIIIIAIILMVLILVDCVLVAISDLSTSRNDEWGLKLSISDVSSKGATIILGRGSSEQRGDVSIDYQYRIQRRYLFRWREMKYEGTQTFYAISYILEEGEEHTLKANWEYRCGRKLSPGLYRIGGLTDDIELYKSFLVIF